MIKVERHDLVVVQNPLNKRKSLVFVDGIVEDKIVGRSFVREAVETINCSPTDVLANLGPKPPTGWVYGVFVGELIKTTVEEGTDVLYKVDLSDEEKELLRSIMRRWKRLSSKLNFRLEVHGLFGNRMGDYVAMKLEKRKDRMRLYKLAFKSELELEHTYIHEMGHGFWRHHMTAHLQARIIKAYTDYIQIKRVELPEIQAVAAAFDEHRGSIAKFMNTIPKEKRPVFRKMLTWIKDVHKIKREDLEKMRRGGLKTREYFPSHHLVQSQVQPVVTNYGTKNVEEFFCESFAYFYQERDMPPELRTAMAGIDDFIELLPDWRDRPGS